MALDQRENLGLSGGEVARCTVTRRKIGHGGYLG